MLVLVAGGYSASEIGEKLFISPKTVETYKQRITEKLGLSHRSDYVQFCLRLGLLKTVGGDRATPVVHRSRSAPALSRRVRARRDAASARALHRSRAHLRRRRRLSHRQAAGGAREPSRSHPRRARHARTPLPQGARPRAREDAARRGPAHERGRAPSAAAPARAAGVPPRAHRRVRRHDGDVCRAPRRALARRRDARRVARDGRVHARRRRQDAVRRRHRGRGARDRRRARRGDRRVQPQRAPVRRAAREASPPDDAALPSRPRAARRDDLPPDRRASRVAARIAATCSRCCSSRTTPRATAAG